VCERVRGCDGSFQFVWRVGDTVDASGIKCLSQTGTPAGAPTVSNVWAYAWVYTW
jgi:hypothetical protein